MTAPKPSQKPWTYCDKTNSVLGADGRPLFGFFGEADDGRWVAEIRSQFDDLLGDAQKLIAINSEQAKALASRDALIKSMREDIERLKWFIDRYLDGRAKG